MKESEIELHFVLAYRNLLEAMRLITIFVITYKHWAALSKSSASGKDADAEVFQQFLKSVENSKKKGVSFVFLRARSPCCKQ